MITLRLALLLSLTSSLAAACSSASSNGGATPDAALDHASSVTSPRHDASGGPHDAATVRHDASDAGRPRTGHDAGIDSSVPGSDAGSDAGTASLSACANPADGEMGGTPGPCPAGLTCTYVACTDPSPSAGFCRTACTTPYTQGPCADGELCLPTWESPVCQPRASCSCAGYACGDAG